jgi:hypothetical protein
VATVTQSLVSLYHPHTLCQLFSVQIINDDQPWPPTLGSFMVSSRKVEVQVESRGSR